MKKIIVAAFLTLAVCGIARAETIESIEDGIVTLDTGDQFAVDDTSGMQVGDDVEVDKTATDSSTGTEMEEY